MVKMFWGLFALPSPKQRHHPKCKSQMSRSATYDLLVEVVKNNLRNYEVLHELVLKQHNKGIVLCCSTRSSYDLFPIL